MRIQGLEKEMAPIMIGTSPALFSDETTPWIPGEKRPGEYLVS